MTVTLSGFDAFILVDPRHQERCIRQSRVEAMKAGAENMLALHIKAWCGAADGDVTHCDKVAMIGKNRKAILQ